MAISSKPLIRTCYFDLSKLKKALKSGERSLKKLLKVSGARSVRAIIKTCRNYNIVLPKDIVPYKTKPRIDALIEKGLPVTAISDITGFTRAGISDYIINSGQSQSWKKFREQYQKSISPKRLKEERASLISILKIRAMQAAREKGRAYEKTIEYLNSYKVGKWCNGKYPVEEIYAVFNRYWKAAEKGKKLPLRKLCINTSIPYPCVSRIFKSVQVEPMFGNIERVFIPKVRKKIIEKGFYSSMCRKDIAYFLGFNQHVVKNVFTRMGRRTPHLIATWIYGTRNGLAYRDASMIYEASDAGFFREEIIELIEKPEEVVDYAMRNRQDIEKRVIAELTAIFGKKIKKPYINPNSREFLYNQ